MFSDRAKIIIRSGKGGDGHVSFRREKFVANGGPDGGDGGKGGDVIFEVDPGLNNLSKYRFRRKFSATDGEEGGKRRCHGKNGEDLILPVPEGTVIYDAATDQVICDMSGENKRVTVLRGGKGGLGNMHFATSTMQVPKFAKPGGDAVEIEIRMELKLLADVGLVGYPNVGKSTLLSVLSNAKPEIGDYPFTTLNPILGVVTGPDGNGFVMADMPGLIEGAAEGVGLGHEFLRHIQRTKVLLHLVDPLGPEEERNPVADVRAMMNELSKYDEAFLEKPFVIALSKADALTPDVLEGHMKALTDAFGAKAEKILAISAQTGQGLDELKTTLKSLIDAHSADTVVYESEFDPMERLAQELPFTVEKTDEGEYDVYGPKIDKLMGYTNLDDEKGFAFFQNFLVKEGIITELKRQGMVEGDTVNVGGYVFEYFE